MDPLLRDELIRDEGCRLAVYQDTNNYWTIGVGHLLGDMPRMSKITMDEATALLAWDVEVARAAVGRLFPDLRSCNCTHLVCEGDRVRERALINMVFNRGEQRMKDSTSITPVIRDAIAGVRPWSAVTTAIAASPWAKQVGARANRLAYMLEHGEVMP